VPELVLNCGRFLASVLRAFDFASSIKPADEPRNWPPPWACHPGRHPGPIARRAPAAPSHPGPPPARGPPGVGQRWTRGAGGGLQIRVDWGRLLTLPALKLGVEIGPTRQSVFGPGAGKIGPHYARPLSLFILFPWVHPWVHPAWHRGWSAGPGGCHSRGWSFCCCSSGMPHRGCVCSSMARSFGDTFLPGAPVPGCPLLAIRPRCLALAIRSWFPRSRLSVPGYPSRLFVPGSRSRSLAPRLSAPGFFVSSVAPVSPGFDLVPLARSTFPRAICGVIARVCSQGGIPRGLLPGGIPEGLLLGRIPRLPAPASISCAPSRTSRSRGCLMLVCPSGRPYRPGEAPVLGVVPGTPVRACRCGWLVARWRLVLAANREGPSRSSMLQALSPSRAPHARRVRAGLPTVRPGRPAIDSRGSRVSCGPGPEHPRPRRMPGRGRCVEGPRRSPGVLLRRGCRRSRRRARPGHRGMSSWRAALAVVPGHGFPGGARPARGDTRLAARRIRRGAHGSGPTALSCARRSSWLLAAPRHTPPHPVTPRRTMLAPRVLGGPRRHDTGGRGVPSVAAHPGPPGRRSVRRATAHPDRGRAHRRAEECPPASGRPGRRNAALHPAGVPLRPPVGPVTVMRHYTRRGCPLSSGRPGRRNAALHPPGVSFVLRPARSP